MRDQGFQIVGREEIPHKNARTPFPITPTPL